MSSISPRAALTQVRCAAGSSSVSFRMLLGVGRNGDLDVAVPLLDPRDELGRAEVAVPEARDLRLAEQ